MSEKYTATGTIENIGPEQTRGSFTFRLITLLIPDEKNEKYDQHVEFQLASRNMSEADKVREGQPATLSFNLRGRIWVKPETGEAKVFNTLDCWRIEPVAGQSTSPPTDGGRHDDDSDGLPF